jgi:hypothetical protein
MGDVMTHQLEVRALEQVKNVGFLGCEEVVEADHVVPLIDQAVAEVRADEARPSGNQNTVVSRHVASPAASWIVAMLSESTWVG